MVEVMEVVVTEVVVAEAAAAVVAVEEAGEMATVAVEAVNQVWVVDPVGQGTVDLNKIIITGAGVIKDSRTNSRWRSPSWFHLTNAASLLEKVGKLFKNK